MEFLTKKFGVFDTNSVFLIQIQHFWYKFGVFEKSHIFGVEIFSNERTKNVPFLCVP